MMMENRKGGIEKVRCRPTGQAGFTLIEGMIAAVILSVGLLALAGMQGVALSKNVDANELAQVTTLNAALMERIKFNRGRALAYHNIDTGNAVTQPPSTEPMARGDYAQWQTLLTNSRMASARGLVSVTRLDPNPTLNPTTLNQFLVTVRINWTATGTGGVARNRTVMFAAVLAPE
ncbi:MAG: prepilin-type N-terminal cleavage/methylation domain-containing protein [Nitrospiraceae bacterium]|nr:prepilin-type N-terminal cleavage/methylation domain-containing protein [Nitrospiraceae bacterium]